MKRNINYLASVILLVLFLSSCSQKELQDEVCFGKSCVKVEVVKSEEDRRRGLMERDSLGEDEGMLFIFDKAAMHPFWMKDTLIPLDIIWMDYARNVVYIARDVPPCEDDTVCPSYGPGQTALYVVEVNAGYVNDNGITVGDVAQFKLKLKDSDR